MESLQERLNGTGVVRQFIRKATRLCSRVAFSLPESAASRDLLQKESPRLEGAEEREAGACARAPEGPGFHGRAPSAERMGNI
jgi:hypothetical protein